MTPFTGNSPEEKSTVIESKSVVTWGQQLVETERRKESFG